MNAKLILNAFLFLAVLGLFALALMKEDNNKATISSVRMEAGIGRREVNDNYLSIEVLEIEGCEYVYVGNVYRSGITHKGNCKNSFHLIN